MRGSIVDLYPPGEEQPFRLDFFGETLETIRVFEPENQRSLDNRGEINLYQASEIRLDDETVTRFRQGYIKQFGPAHHAINSMKPYLTRGGIKVWNIGSLYFSKIWKYF